MREQLLTSSNFPFNLWNSFFFPSLGYPFFLIHTPVVAFRRLKMRKISTFFRYPSRRRKNVNFTNWFAFLLGFSSSPLTPPTAIVKGAGKWLNLLFSGWLACKLRFVLEPLHLQPLLHNKLFLDPNRILVRGILCKVEFNQLCCSIHCW